MRDALIVGAAIVIAGIVVSVGLNRAAQELSDLARFEVAGAADGVAVLDRRTGQVQTFERSGDPRILTYVGSHSRERWKEQQDAAGKPTGEGQKAAPAK